MLSTVALVDLLDVLYMNITGTLEPLRLLTRLTVLYLDNNTLKGAYWQVFCKSFSTTVVWDLVCFFAHIAIACSMLTRFVDQFLLGHSFAYSWTMYLSQHFWLRHIATTCQHELVERIKAVGKPS
jgi:hypothetical protein